MLHVTGSGSYAALLELAGTHRVQRVPDNDRRGRRHTSTATIAVLPHEATEVAKVNRGDVRVDRMRGHGAGGQRRNKVETAVRVTHVPTGTVVTRTSGRSQADNLASALAQLEADLTTRSRQHHTSERARERAGQVRAERAAKSFTHCWYRDKVTDHAAGRTWSVRQWEQGRID